VSVDTSKSSVLMHHTLVNNGGMWVVLRWLHEVALIIRQAAAAR